MECRRLWSQGCCPALWGGVRLPWCCQRLSSTVSWMGSQQGGTALEALETARRTFLGYSPRRRLTREGWAELCPSCCPSQADGHSSRRMFNEILGYTWRHFERYFPVPAVGLAFSSTMLQATGSGLGKRWCSPLFWPCVLVAADGST